MHWSYIFLALTHRYVVTFENHLFHEPFCWFFIMHFAIFQPNNRQPLSLSGRVYVLHTQLYENANRPDNTTLLTCTLQGFKVHLWLLLFINYTNSFSETTVLNSFVAFNDLAKYEVTLYVKCQFCFQWYHLQLLEYYLSIYRGVIYHFQTKCLWTI